MKLKLAIQEARKEAAAFGIAVYVVRQSDGSYCPARKDWVEGFDGNPVAVCLPNGKQYRLLRTI